MSERRDIVVTWPKDRALTEYLETLEWAARNGREINYRVHRPPTWPDAFLDHGTIGWPYGVADRPRCYRIHDGFVRGWTVILYCCRRGEHEVELVGGEGWWPAGHYVVCDPEWHAIEPVAMRGFQGWRWYVV